MRHSRLVAGGAIAITSFLSILTLNTGTTASAAPNYNQITFTPGPIAPPGSLIAGQVVNNICVAAALNGNAVTSFTAYVSLKTLNSEGAPGGTAKIGSTALTGTPGAFSTTTGCISVIYTAPIPIPTAGRDEIVAQDAATSPTIMYTSSYSFTGLGVSASPYVPLAPQRICDTRTGGSPAQCAGHHLGPLGTLDVTVTGVGGVPANGVSAVVLNVTTVNGTASSYFKVYPKGQPATVSNLSFPAQTTLANLVEVGVGLQNEVEIFNAAGTADAVLDVQGYVPTNQVIGDSSLTPSTAGLFHPTEPLPAGPLSVRSRYPAAPGRRPEERDPSV